MITLPQLRAVLAVVDNALSVSRAATAIHTTQPAVSKLVRTLEVAVGLEMFVRRGNRLVALTDAGQEAVSLARRALNDVRSISNLSHAYGAGRSGSLRVGTTLIHARYALLPIVQRFNAEYPEIDFELVQGAPAEIVRWVSEGAVDFGVSTLPRSIPDGIEAFEAYPITRCLVVPQGHPLASAKRLTLERIAKYPFVAYDESYNSGWVVQEEFRRKGLAPRVVVRATDANVIKAYVAAGLGIAVLQQMAIDRETDSALVTLSTKGLFADSSAQISIRRGKHVRAYMRAFIDMVLATKDARPQGSASKRSRPSQ